MLTFIGLGLFDEYDISLKGLEAVKEADLVYAEFYTSCLMGTNPEKMEKLYGKKVHLLSREDVEQHPDWLDNARDKKVAFLTGGDTMVSTTHVDLRLRAEKLGIETRLIHGASITSAVSGLTGLQNYRFGKSASIPYPYESRRGTKVISETPYDTIKQNSSLGLHTLVFLDIDKNKGFMSVNIALELLLEVERKRGEGVMDRAVAVGIARAGSEKPVVKAGYAEDLKGFDFGKPLHILVVPGKLHFLEAEALVKLADGPEEIMENIE
ncbi:diphthine synthase [Methanosarcina mazei]|uniref:Diphthine synthase n=1 Tax=Methanosarcina mazei TaxID=2209 RepID=A0A0F8ISI8_METMZ|nr:diphthine synthase [Methanosarcina mazei]KKG49715.1 diphthine synthase [Methanosarcina mazei]KKG57440.1 diphthine synthase [Methanosarcina mazei]KKG59730.1 diphthine synthase [Methanosarcina mazei]KKG95791.1 diphthine synthase [Methanosarcina mazei]KKG97861.1 diphthine synthase [Methanosarcina mazei]